MCMCVCGGGGGILQSSRNICFTTMFLKTASLIFDRRSKSTQPHLPRRKTAQVGLPRDNSENILLLVICFTKEAHEIRDLNLQSDFR